MHTLHMQSNAGAPRLRIAIAGAGLSGLALAQGLRRHGILAQIYERDAGPQARSQGYRLRIDSAGRAALRELLDGDADARFLAACAPTLPLASHDAQLNHIATPWAQAWEHAADAGPASADVSGDLRGDLRADRGLMREALMQGLEAQLHWGQELLDAQPLADGRVSLRLAGGRSEVCDLLVVANGAHSVLRRQPWRRAPEAMASCVYGRTALDQAWLRQLPAGFLEATRVIVDPAAVAIVDAMRFAPGSAVPDYLYWALLLPENRAGLGEGPRLREQLLQRCRHWAAPALAMLVHTEPAAIRAVPVFGGAQLDEASPIEAGLCIAAMGDAVHLMSPAGGLGANTALQDAADLAQTLTALDSGGAMALGPALAGYEQRLRRRANAAMASSDRSHAQLCQSALALTSSQIPASVQASTEAACN